MIDSETIKKARQANIAEYLLSIGEPLKRNGRRYKHTEHDSLVFTDNSYFWNSEQEHGNAIDYLTRHHGMTFADAVTALTGYTADEARETPDSQTAALQISRDCRRGIAYLNKTRKIDYDIIIELVKQGRIQQEAETNNLIFPMIDENGETVGAELQGTLSDRRFKGVRGGSKYGYGFNLKYGNPEYIMFFESAVDLLSFVNLVKLKGKELQDCLLVSMSGVKTNVVEHYLQAFNGSVGVFSCVDNDNAGTEFETALQGLKIAFKPHHCDPAYKDWNEQLQAVKLSGTGTK